jgi:hypothetical protein
MNKRVLHCPSVVGFHPLQLSAIEKGVGLDSVTLNIGAPIFGRGGDYNIRIDGICWPVSIALRFFWFLYALVSFDVIHYNFGLSLFPVRNTANKDRMSFFKKLVVNCYNFAVKYIEFKDLFLFKLAGKRIVVTFQGDDCRQWDYCRSNHEISHVHEVDPLGERLAADELARYRVTQFSRYADIIYALNPDLLAVLPKRARFFPYSVPDLDLVSFIGIDDHRLTPIRVLHAPSHRGTKGTRFVLDAVSVLKKEGLFFEFVLVENLSHAEAMEAYASADVLIDQLLVGWFGGLSAELMALGKVVVCYLRETDFGHLPDGYLSDLPIINACPSSVCDVLRDVITMDRSALKSLGERGRHFVEKWQGSTFIAARLKEDYGV